MTINLCFADVAAEKTQQTLIAGIEKFDTALLKHTKTEEKNPLPDKESELLVFKFFFKRKNKVYRGNLVLFQNKVELALY